MSKLQIEQVNYSEAISAIKAIRVKVFQEEQGVAEDLEFDGLDETAIQLLAYLDRKPVGTARIRYLKEQTVNTGALKDTASHMEYASLPEEFPLVKIERLAVLSEARGNGVGKKLMETALKIAASKNYKIAIVHAQEYIKQLYQQLGFEQIGASFKEAGIVHVKMIKTIS
ncbi:GCN5-related N-acetyltransferase [Hyella patelloides LEGE 07179]|uniref:GCN5-related N-acetyltransferase n=1 Tax=Hyella patelloides LEGE 07179 TaxID=945734 RepID=A0A563W3Y8_9CYAN|nr:GNAT family N-acetyltransferase [Hyella patelloides]VEP18375.1 GCN5-related N-acetyltransferase [Hyella patelloides LEGE 07179]